MSLKGKQRIALLLNADDASDEDAVLSDLDDDDLEEAIVPGI